MKNTFIMQCYSVIATYSELYVKETQSALILKLYLMVHKWINKLCPSSILPEIKYGNLLTCKEAFVSQSIEFPVQS